MLWFHQKKHKQLPIRTHRAGFLVRFQLEYAYVTWDPYQINDISNLKKVQKEPQDLSNKTTLNITV